MSATTCNVCLDIGNFKIANTHSTRGPKDPVMESVIICGGWNLIKPLGGTTNCPTLQQNICENPNCFNGMDKLIRFSTYGHTSR